VAGQTTTFTYNAAGQILTVTPPPRAGITENRTTTYTYDTNGYLQSMTGPETGVSESYTFDGYGRVRTVTDSDNYTVTYDYDALDRVTKRTYPDGTYEEIVFNRLDPEKRRDRLGAGTTSSTTRCAAWWRRVTATWATSVTIGSRKSTTSARVARRSRNRARVSGLLAVGLRVAC
jgi:YD repeat-containing protein